MKSGIFFCVNIGYNKAWLYFIINEGKDIIVEKKNITTYYVHAINVRNNGLWNS